MQNINTILPIIHPLMNYNIILANGLFPQEQIILDKINNADNIICCDGAINKLSLYTTNEPNYIIGDCDSIGNELQIKYKDKIIKIEDQNINDLTKATQLAKMLKLDNILILGATGLREDHTLANISLLADYIELFNNVAILSDYGIFTAHKGSCNIQTVPKQQISFFTLDLDTKISVQELKWPLNELKLASWKSGTLNESTNDYLNITINQNQKIIVYRAFCTK